MRLLPGCFAGGVVMGLFSVKAYAFVFTSALTTVAMKPTFGYIIGITVAFVTSFLLVVFFDYRSADEKAEVLAQIAAEEGKEDSDDAAGDDAPAAAASAEATAAAPVAAAATATATASATATAVAEAPAKTALEPGAVTELTAPLEGKALPLSEVPDPIFAGGRLGDGVAIEPSNNTVVAPADAKVLMVQKSGHAVALRLDSGVEVLIHVGLDTVPLGGEGL